MRERIGPSLRPLRSRCTLRSYRRGSGDGLRLAGCADEEERAGRAGEDLVTDASRPGAADPGTAVARHDDEIRMDALCLLEDRVRWVVPRDARLDGHARRSKTARQRVQVAGGITPRALQ